MTAARVFLFVVLLVGSALWFLSELPARVWCWLSDCWRYSAPPRDLQ